MGVGSRYNLEVVQSVVVKYFSHKICKCLEPYELSRYRGNSWYILGVPRANRSSWPSCIGWRGWEGNTKQNLERNKHKIRTGPLYSSDYTLSDSDNGHGLSDATRPHTQPPPLSTSPWPFQS